MILLAPLWLFLVPVCEPGANNLRPCLPDVHQAEKKLSDYPALMTIYDPSLGGINCDDDCSTVATGPLTEDMWFTSGACHPNLLGAIVYFPGIDFEMRCVDTGPMIGVRYNKYYGETVLYFDAMWDSTDLPSWVQWNVGSWYISGWWSD